MYYWCRSNRDQAYPKWTQDQWLYSCAIKICPDKPGAHIGVRVYRERDSRESGNTRSGWLHPHEVDLRRIHSRRQIIKRNVWETFKHISWSLAMNWCAIWQILQVRKQKFIVHPDTRPLRPKDSSSFPWAIRGSEIQPINADQQHNHPKYILTDRRRELWDPEGNSVVSEWKRIERISLTCDHWGWFHSKSDCVRFGQFPLLPFHLRWNYRSQVGSGIPGALPLDQEVECVYRNYIISLTRHTRRAVKFNNPVWEARNLKTHFWSTSLVLPIATSV
jgi:hypothetical protein